MSDDTTQLTPHLRRLAGLDLEGAAPPLVHVDLVAERAVVVSRSRTLAREVYLDRCRADGVPVVLRPSGGGAVVLAPGMAVASVLAARRPGEAFPDPIFRRFVGAVAAALRSCGAPRTVMRGISDLCIGDRKVAGSSLRLWQRTLLFQVSILVDPDLSLLDRYLPMPSRMPAYRQQRGHREFVTSLAACGCRIAPSCLLEALAHHLGAAAGCVPCG